MVVEQEQPIVRVAKKLLIKLPTARLIVEKYNKTGTFTIKKKEKLSSKTIQRPQKEILENIEVEP